MIQEHWIMSIPLIILSIAFLTIQTWVMSDWECNASRSADQSIKENDTSGALSENATLDPSLASFLPLIDPTLPVKRPKDLYNRGHKTSRPRATILMLCRNSDLPSIVDSVLPQFEHIFNKRFCYPYTLLNDQPFTEHFKQKVMEVITGHGKDPNRIVKFGQIPSEHWSIPDHVSMSKIKQGMNLMIRQKAIYGTSISYRQMCRWYSGFFFKHPLLDEFDWYWRIEPDVKYFCVMPYDPFAWMEQEGKVYGFNIMLSESPIFVQTLWSETKKFFLQERRGRDDDEETVYAKEYDNLRQLRTIYSNKQADPKPNDGQQTMLDALLWKAGDLDTHYNRCHFWSNFEIARLDFFRSPAYQAYFDHLDQTGGFFYERWGDAPMHTLAIGLFLHKQQVHYFEDIGYEHPGNVHCPSNPTMLQYCGLRCNDQERNPAIERNMCLQRFMEATREPEFVRKKYIKHEHLQRYLE